VKIQVENKKQTNSCAVSRFLLKQKCALWPMRVMCIETGSLGDITDWLLPSRLGIDVPRVFFFVEHFKHLFISCHVPLNFTGSPLIICYYYYFITACKQIPIWKPILSSLISHVHSYFPYVIFTTCCATNRKVAGSIPAGVIGIFN